MTLLAYMVQCRMKTVEQLQYAAPGELGKLMGLDRVPEVRCLRQKLTQRETRPRSGRGSCHASGWRPLPIWPGRCT